MFSCLVAHATTSLATLHLQVLTLTVIASHTMRLPLGLPGLRSAGQRNQTHSQCLLQLVLG